MHKAGKFFTQDVLVAFDEWERRLSLAPYRTPSRRLPRKRKRRPPPASRTDLQGAYLPSARDILDACAAIRHGWTKAERRNRKVGGKRRWRPPVMPAIHPEARQWRDTDNFAERFEWDYLMLEDWDEYMNALHEKQK